MVRDTSSSESGTTRPRYQSGKEAEASFHRQVQLRQPSGKRGQARQEASPRAHEDERDLEVIGVGEDGEDPGALDVAGGAVTLEDSLVVLATVQPPSCQ